MYTTKDIKSITVQSVYLIIIRMNDNKSYIIDAQELVDIINKKIYLKKCRNFKLDSEVSDDLKAKLDGYESEIRDRMSKSKGKSESSNELRSKFSASELDTIDKIIGEIEKFKEIIGGKCDQGSDLGSDLGAAEAAHLPPPQALPQALQVVSPTLSPLESKVSDFISNSFSSNSPNSPNPTDNSIDNPIVIDIIDSVISTPNSTPTSNTPTISDCINTINTDVNTINTSNNSSNSYYCKIDNNICSSRCNSDNPSISDTTHIKTVNSSSKRVNSSANSTNRFKRFIKAIKSIFKTTRYN